MDAPGQRLKLVPLRGPALAELRFDPGADVVLGRSATSDVQLADPAVSRRHARLVSQAGAWFITDLASRAGVLLNAQLLAPDTPTPLSDLDLVAIGPWTFRVHVGVASAAMRTIAMGPDRLDPGERVESVPERELRSIARRRLDLLIECAASINAATSERALARAVVDAAREGTGFPRAALFRVAGDGVAVLASGGEAEVRADSFSRTLITMASSGQIARLSHDVPMTHGESIARLGIQAAVCAPLMIGTAVDAFLYLDDRRRRADMPGGEARPDTRTEVRADAAAFCQALCRIGGLALANLRRAALERLNADIMRDVGAAAEAQRLLMPQPDGVCRGVAYSVRMRPGRFVAGDLFNLLPLSGSRVGVYLGDVAGKGVGAAILMATTQALLNAALRECEGPADALGRVGGELAHLLPGGRFISLWVGILDPATGRIRFVDAGHGHWLVRSGPAGEPERLPVRGGLPLGIDPERPYEDEQLTLPPGSRLILHSDGVHEQRSRDGEEFGVDRIVQILRACGSSREEAEGLFRAVREFAPGDALDDDVTIASIELPGGRGL
ncbi:MAG: SpoIIE family protein phosphatase [Phycisphaerales bacterium]|nr:SpoIIE family protein phosphatase [Phycisphaerales bacterium]